jgi:CRISPR/Cas system-associated exonuclease Cas4 (RecB family)
MEAARGFVLAQPPGTQMLLVGAGRDAVDELARGALLPECASFGLHRFSFLQLAAYLSRGAFARQGLAPATALASEAMAARAGFEARSHDGLEYFAPVVPLRGFAATLAATLQELRSADIFASTLRASGPSGQDLQTLLRRYEEQLEQGGLADRATLFRTAIRELHDAAPFFTDWPLLLLDVPAASHVERAFLQALTERAGPVLATIPAGDTKAAAAFSGLGTAVASSAANQSSSTPLHRVQFQVFSLDSPELSPEATSANEDVVLFSSPGEGRECVEIARRIIKEAHEGKPFDRIAVVLRSPALYSSLLEAALRRAGIPAYFARGVKAPDPSGRAFVSLLSFAVEGFSARRFGEYLSLSQVPPLDSAGGPPAARAVWVGPEDEALSDASSGAGVAAEPPPDDASHDDDGRCAVVAGSLRTPWNWERLLVEAAVIGGRERWRRRLDGLREEWEIRLVELERTEPGSGRALAAKQELANLEHLRAFCIPLIDRLAELPQSAAWGDWLPLLEQLAPTVLRRPERVLALLAELRPMTAVGPVALEEVRDVLAERLTTVQAASPDVRFGRVFVASPEQMRGRSFDVVFVPGLAERLFPEKLRDDPLLPDAMRAALGEIDTRSARAEEERLRLRLAIGAAGRRLYLSYPRMQLAEFRPRVPSFYALDLERARTGLAPDASSLERAAWQQGGARLAWPAPERSSDAIDDFEYDLATLAPLLHRSDPAAVRGRARYLLELNPALARSLRTRYARWMRSAWSPHDGLCLSTPAGRGALEPYRLRERAYSASSLRHFAACPYRFLLAAVYRLEPREEPAPLEKMDPLTRGALFHRVQAELSRELLRDGAFPLSPQNLEAPLRRLDGTLDRVAEEYREALAPAIERVWRDEVETLRGDLRGWLARQAELPGEWRPIHFELGFGLPVRDSMDRASTPREVALENGCRIHGIVDLVEQRSGAGELRVTDYKTGRDSTPPALIVAAGEVLQPVLYGFAVESALEAPVTESRLYYCTADGAYAEKIVQFDETARRTGLAVLDIIDRAIGSGFLPPAPRDGACDWCDFRAVCGPHEELRASRKSSAPLADLIRLRGLP